MQLCGRTVRPVVRHRSRVLVIGVLVVVVAPLLWWVLSCSIPPGIYVGDLEASQLVVQRFVSGSLPILWVPEWPWEPAPRFGELRLTLEDGSEIEMATASPTFLGRGPSRPGFLPFFFRATDSMEEGYRQRRVVKLSVETAGGTIECVPTSLIVVECSSMSDGAGLAGVVTVTSAVYNETLLFRLSVAPGQTDVELVAVGLPFEAYPLFITGPGIQLTKLSLPYKLEPGSWTIVTNISGGRHDGSILIMPFLGFRLQGNVIHNYTFSTSFYFSGSTPETRYHISTP